MKSTTQPPRTTLLTGPRGVGKTTCVLKLATALKDLGISVFGVATPKIFDGDKVVGLAVQDLATGERIPLALIDDEPGIRQGPWRFLHEGISFANNACDPMEHEGFAVIDEIGPLELRGEGFVASFEALQKGQYSNALVVVRPELADQAARKMKGEVSIIHWETNCLDTLIAEISQAGKITRL